MAQQSKSILILGGTGLLGQYFKEFFTQKGFLVRIASRSKNSHTIFWNPKTEEYNPELIENLDVVINLCGVGVADKRWSKKQKEEIISSRVQSAVFFRNICKENNVRPNQYLSASGVSACGYDDILKDETSPYGTDFLSRVVQKWEESALLMGDICPVGIVRIGFVLTPNKGGLEKLTKTIKMGIGSPIGTGKQIVSWVHYLDVIGVFNHLIDHELSGIYNSASPNAVNNEELTHAIGSQLNKKILRINVPSFVIQILFGEMSEIILKGQRVSVQKLINSGYNFQYPTIQEALEKLAID